VLLNVNVVGKDWTLREPDNFFFIGR